VPTRRRTGLVAGVDAWTPVKDDPAGPSSPAIADGLVHDNEDAVVDGAASSSDRSRAPLKGNAKGSSGPVYFVLFHRPLMVIRDIQKQLQEEQAAAGPQVGTRPSGSVSQLSSGAGAKTGGGIRPVYVRVYWDVSFSRRKVRCQPDGRYRLHRVAQFAACCLDVCAACRGCTHDPINSSLLCCSISQWVLYHQALQSRYC